MALLPQPSTTSPGFLVLLYGDGTTSHRVRFAFVAGADISDITADAGEAQNLADQIGAAMLNTMTITDWQVQDPTGVVLHQEPLGTPVTGGISVGTGIIPSDSTTVDFIGKGVPDFGLAQGKTRVMFFTGYFDTTNFRDKSIAPASTNPIYNAILLALNTSTLVGADHYGSKAVYVDRVDIQINAHYQKRYGL